MAAQLIMVTAVLGAIFIAIAFTLQVFFLA